MKFIKSLLEESKSVRGGVDIGDGFKVMRIGIDANGNWSYWIATQDGRARKIQATNLNGGSGKVTNINDFNTPESDGVKNLIKAYYNEHM